MAVKKIATNSHFQTATYSKGLPFPSPSIMKGCPFTAPSIQSLIFMSGLIALCEKKVEWISDLRIYKPEEKHFLLCNTYHDAGLKVRYQSNSSSCSDVLSPKSPEWMEPQLWEVLL